MTYLQAERGMCVGPHPLTAEAGVNMLREGGNAFDAAVAAAFTEAVVEPAHNGVGGYGGALVAYVAGEQRVISIDFNSRAPAAATADMFDVKYGDDGTLTVPARAHLYGERAVGVNGIVSGLLFALEHYGVLARGEVLQPAIRAARSGWTVTLNTSRALEKVIDTLRARFPQTARLVACQNGIPQPGDSLRNPELADTLERIDYRGAAEFYEGETARAIVDCLRAGGNGVTLDDWASYAPRLDAPLTSRFNGYDLFTPPLGAGGLTALQMLRVYESFTIPDSRTSWLDAMHLHIEVIKACWRERLTKYGDPRFVDVDMVHELSEELVDELCERVRGGLLRPQCGELIAPEPFNSTSHLCAADADGNVVSLTQTHGAALGSLVTVPGTGITLGHGMARFDPRPGRPNSIAGGKEPLHNMSPMLAMKDDRPYAAYGLPGGRTIPNNQAHITINLLQHRMTPLEAISVPRVSCDSIEPVNVEETVGNETMNALRELGHEVALIDRVGGSASVILFGKRPGEFVGATDPRGQGKVAHV